MFLFATLYDNLRKSIVRINGGIIILGLLVLINRSRLMSLLGFREFVCFVGI